MTDGLPKLWQHFNRIEYTAQIRKGRQNKGRYNRDVVEFVGKYAINEPTNRKYNGSKRNN